jgi:hypothetical protein
VNRRRLAGATLATLALIATGCGGKPAGGDPGNRRLQELAGDPVFAAFPPRSRAGRVSDTPARYQRRDIAGGGWHGPGIVARFVSSAPAEEVYAFYAQRAAAAGWVGTKTGPLGFTNTWAKTYPDGAPATLLLLVVDPGAAERRYALFGSIGLAAG